MPKCIAIKGDNNICSEIYKVELVLLVSNRIHSATKHCALLQE